MGYNKETRTKYLEANKTKIAKQKRDYYLANEKTTIAYQKTWHSENKDKKVKNQKRRMVEDVLYKLKVNVKNLIGNSIRNGNFKKVSPTEQILGCSYNEFKAYIESKFEDWMNWDNRALFNGSPNFGWDIDHIIPLSTAKCEADIIRLNHYTNLQPLCSFVNRYIKRNR